MATIITNQATLNYRYGGVSASTVSNITSAVFGASLDIEKTSLNESYRVGEGLTYIITLNNSGAALDEVTVSDNLGSYNFNGTILTPLTYTGPARLFVNGVFVSELTPEIDENEIIFFIENLPANANAQIVYQATPNQFANRCCGDFITNTATAECNCPCNIPASSSNTLTADCFADVRIVKSVCPNPIICGEEVTYIFDISNYGNIPATDVVLTDTFNPPLTDITVSLNVNPLSPLDYSYINGTLTIPSEDSSLDLTVPAATCVQNPQTGEITIVPGNIQIVVSGNI
ncbi:MAG: DUF11 domain-containing protein [Ruminococcaceae bacterium]|nr:DUF11 domain-containing protein [Oscillospiraceae bacterium]